MSDERTIDVIRFANLSVRDQLAEHLAELLLDADQIFVTLDTTAARDFEWLDPEIRKLCDDVTILLQRIGH